MPYDQLRYDYAGPYKTFERANASLEDSFAQGEISMGQGPRIERRSRKTASWSHASDVFYITLLG